MSSPSSPTGTILQSLAAQLDAIEAELRRLDWWSENPPDLLAEVAAGRLKSYLDAPTFELWLQGVFLPNARTRVTEADLPATSSVGEMARRQYDSHSFVPEAKQLMELLRQFDELLERYHAPPAPAPAIPPEMAEMFAQSRGLLLLWLDQAEDQLRRKGWWEDDGDDPPPAFGRWMRDTMISEARASIGLGIVPAACDLAGQAAARLAGEGLSVPDELLPSLTNFDEGVNTYHTMWNLCGLPQPVPVVNSPATPPSYRGEIPDRQPGASRIRLAPAPVEPMGFEYVLEEAREILIDVLDDIEVAVDELPPDLPPPARGQTPVEEWLTEEFLPDVREWLEKGQVPAESEVAVSAAQEFAARGVTRQTEALLATLRAFDAKVMDFHRMADALLQKSAGSRMAAAWRLIMATPELIEPFAPEPDVLRLQMLLHLNRIEAELHLLGWWCAVPRPMPAPYRDTLVYSEKGREDRERPRFEAWLLAVWLPAIRERVQSSLLPESLKLHNDVLRAFSEERIGREKHAEARRIMEAFSELEMMVHRDWPAAMQRHHDSKRRRGLTPPSGLSPAIREAKSLQTTEYRSDVAEAVKLATHELKSLGWWGGDAPEVKRLVSNAQAMEASGPPPFEHWFQAVYFPEVRARIKGKRPLEERRVRDYVALECRLCGQSEAASALLKQLEKVDHWSVHANRAQREEREK